MTFDDVAALIDSLGIPSAYYQFPNDTEQAPPFICFYYPGSDDLFADNKNYQKIEALTIELYTDEKDFDLESQLEAALIEAGLPYSRDETYIESERLHVTTYNTEVIINADNQ